MQNARLAFLFRKYTQHQCTSQEYQELMRLIDEAGDENMQQLLDGFYSGDADKQLPEESAAQILDRILAVKQPSFIYRSRYWLSGAAACLLLGVALYLGFGGSPQLAVTPPQGLTENVNSNNDHRFIRLADGSTVTLNKNSQLSYSKSFNSKVREVTLIGEGYFDIKHDKSKPFLVHAGNLTVNVLGTAFNVNMSNRIAVTVTRGKVSVIDAQKRLLGVITPGQQINYQPDTREAKKLEVSADLAVEWQSTDLFFDNTTMKDAALILEKRFGKKIIFQNEKSKNCVFSTSFTHGQNLDQILKIICAFNGDDYAADGDTITIKGNGC